MPTFPCHARSDKALHQIALMGANIGFQQWYTEWLQRACQPAQLAKALGIDTQHQLLLKAFKRQVAQLDIRALGELGQHRRSVLLLYKSHAGLRGQQHLQGARLCRQPVFNLAARRRVPPVAGQDKALAVVGGHGRSSNTKRKDGCERELRTMPAWLGAGRFRLA